MTQHSPTFALAASLRTLRPALLALCIFVLGSAGATAEKAADLQVKGTNKAQKENILAHVGRIEQDQLRDFISLQGQVREKANTAMQALGFFNARFRVEVADEELLITVEPGPPTTINTLQLQLIGPGDKHPKLAELIARNPLAVGETFVSANYESFKTTLLSTAQQAGYLQADFRSHKVSINTRLQQASIELALDTGQQYHFGQLSFSDSPISLLRLQQLASWEEQAKFSLATLNSLQKRLTDTGYFQSVILERHIDHQQALVNIHAKLLMAKPNKLVTGVGFGTDTGPRAKIGWAKPWLNAAGHSMETELAGSGIGQSFTAAYKIPSARRRESYWKTELKLSEEDYEDTRSSGQNIGLGYVTPMGNGWKGSLFVKYAVERYTQGSDRGRSELLLPGVSASITRARGGLIPVSGFSYAATFEGANDGLLSDASFFRLSGNARWLQSYGKHRLLQGLQLGGIALYGSTRLDDIPSSLRFFAGGDQSIRGYDYKSIAPRGSDNELSGGKYLAVTRSEYGYRFARSWRAALFVDAGAAFNDINDKFYLGPGFGLHWLSPIGAVRFDIGVSASEDQSIELHISLGPEL